MSRAPAVSVVIPTRDRPALAATAVACATAQEDVAVEVIVVDDGSSAEAAGRLRALVGDEAAIVRHDRSRGVAAARNAGIERASADWIAFLDDDDLWAPGKLREQLAVARAEEAGLVHTGVALVDARRTVLDAVPVRGGPDVLAELVARNVVTTPSCVLVATALVREEGGFDERLSILADWDLWLRLAQRTRVAACPRLLTAYTEHAGSMSVVRRHELRAELALMREKHRALADRLGGKLGGAEFDRWIAASVRRAGHPWRASRLYAAAGLRHRDPGALARAVALLGGAGPLAVARGLRRRLTAAPAAEVAWIAASPRREAG
jgi:glycosyltransferase involved in cell wall biosynthesis